MVKVFPNFDLSERIKLKVLEMDAATVRDLLRQGVARYGETFTADMKKVSIVVNGRNISYLGGMDTRLTDGDEVWFLVPSAGG